MFISHHVFPHLNDDYSTACPVTPLPDPDKPVYSYDFDGVLHLDMVPDGQEPGLYHNRDFWRPDTWPPFEAMHRQLREQAAHATIVVVTARCRDNAAEVWAFLRLHDLPVQAVHCTDDGPKRDVLLAIGAERHYDDRDYSQELAGSGVQFIRVDPGPHLLGARPSDP